MLDLLSFSLTPRERIFFTPEKSILPSEVFKENDNKSSTRPPPPTKRKGCSDEKSKDRSKDKGATKESSEKDRGRDKTRKRRSASSGSSSTRWGWQVRALSGPYFQGHGPLLSQRACRVFFLFIDKESTQITNLWQTGLGFALIIQRTVLVCLFVFFFGGIRNATS